MTRNAILTITVVVIDKLDRVAVKLFKPEQLFSYYYYYVLNTQVSSLMSARSLVINEFVCVVY